MMSHSFLSDATYFEFLASQQQDVLVRNELLSIAGTYRALSKSKDGHLFGTTREDLWRKRAEECRTLSDGTASVFCRAKLVRLAEAYDLLSGDVKVQFD